MVSLWVVALGSGAEAAPLTVAVLHSDPDIADVAAKVWADDRIAVLDLIDLRVVTPTLDDLLPYDAVLAYSRFPLMDGAAVGDVLADYSDEGGGVVQAVFSWAAGWDFEGRWRDEDYSAFRSTTRESGTPQFLVPRLAGHPLLEGVASFDGGTDSFLSTGLVLAPGVTVVAEWSGGEPLVMEHEPSWGVVVALNFYPASSDASARWWDSSTDGDVLLANSLVFAAGDQGPALTIGGACPGAMTIDITGVSAGAPWALLLSGTEGAAVLPGGPCAGTVSGLGDIRLGTRGVADAFGTAALSRPVPPDACGLNLQALDLSRCAAGAVEEL
jgi:hypothetical protein